MALMRDNKTWKLAQILEIRHKKDVNSDEEPEDYEVEKKGASAEEAERQQKTDNDNPEQGQEEARDGHHRKEKKPVEYYVNYVEEQRLLDRWVQANMVRIDDELTEDLLRKWKDSEAKKKMESESSTFFAHNEHD
jgi:hypothetical protein